MVWIVSNYTRDLIMYYLKIIIIIITAKLINSLALSLFCLLDIYFYGVILLIMSHSFLIQHFFRSDLIHVLLSFTCVGHVQNFWLLLTSQNSLTFYSLFWFESRLYNPLNHGIFFWDVLIYTAIYIGYENIDIGYP